MGMQVDIATMKKVWRFLKKLGIKLSYDTAIPLLGTYPAKTISDIDTLP